ncbi:hypothetical protein SDC9_155540 [bioreactor metagenome]|uniref:Uncharacterized protein n=1 Tax=bioreactor metagenome TaxID=1076179 RepID=A0A645F1S2_9ZZZZ
MSAVTSLRDHNTWGFTVLGNIRRLHGHREIFSTGCIRAVFLAIPTTAIFYPMQVEVAEWCSRHLGGVEGSVFSVWRQKQVPVLAHGTEGRKGGALPDGSRQAKVGEILGISMIPEQHNSDDLVQP